MRTKLNARRSAHSGEACVQARQSLESSPTLKRSPRFAAIVSGIPLLNHGIDKRRALVESAFRWLAPGGPLIQFSYGFHSPVKPPPDISVRLAAFVWKNLPPATVWVYRRRNER